MTEFKHIIRLANTDIKGEKPLQHALRRVKGVSFMLANAICIVGGFDKNKKAGELTDTQITKLDQIVRNPGKYGVPMWMLNRRKDPETGEDKHLIMGDLDFAREMDIKILKKMKSYRGLRHQWGLPVRGQRTKSNFRRNKGKGLGVKRKKGKSGRV